MDAAHELRHAWQDERGMADADDRLTHDEEMARVFMIEADARAFSVGVAWELKQAGDPDAWDYVANHSREYKLTAQRFADHMDRLTDLGLQDTGASDVAMKQAMRVGYETWFSHHQNRDYYQEKVNHDQGYDRGVQPGWQQLNDDFIIQLGQMPKAGPSKASSLTSYLNHNDLALARHYAAMTNDPAQGIGTDDHTTIRQHLMAEAAAQNQQEAPFEPNNPQPAAVLPPRHTTPRLA